MDPASLMRESPSLRGLAPVARNPAARRLPPPAVTECREFIGSALLNVIKPCPAIGNQMPRLKRRSDDGLTKFQRYRLSKERQGMKLLRVWVPDPSRPEFAREAERQAELLRARPEQNEALDFIAAAFTWPEP
jgi:hypothetical protein